MRIQLYISLVPRIVLSFHKKEPGCIYMHSCTHLAVLGRTCEAVSSVFFYAFKYFDSYRESQLLIVPTVGIHTPALGQV